MRRPWACCLSSSQSPYGVYGLSLLLALLAPKAQASQNIVCPEGHKIVLGAFTSNGTLVCELCDPGSRAVVDCNSEALLGYYCDQWCETCPEGTYSNTSGATECRSCQAGSFSDNAGSSQCQFCLAGWYNEEDGGSLCSRCTPGTSTNVEGSTSCEECEPGYFSTAYASTSCEKCWEGSFASFARATQCGMCPPGSIATERGQSYCEECAPGTYTGEWQMSECWNCTKGRYSSEPGQSACSACSAGSYAEHERSTDCALCEVGTYMPFNEGTGCDLCGQGTYSADIGRSESCDPCLGGTFSNEEGMSSCITCPAGGYSGSGEVQCHECNHGTFNPFTGMSECQSCMDAGEAADMEWFSDNLGATQCGNCNGYAFPDILPRISLGLACQIDTLALTGLAAMTTGIFLLFLLVPTIFSYSARIVNVTGQDGEEEQVIIRTHSAHSIRRRRNFHRGVRVSFSSTDHPRLEDKRKRSEEGSFAADFSVAGIASLPGKLIIDAATSVGEAVEAVTEKVWSIGSHSGEDDAPVDFIPETPAVSRRKLPEVTKPESLPEGAMRRAEALSSHLLLLLDHKAEPIQGDIETSQGFMHVPFPDTLWVITHWDIPLGVLLLALIIMCCGIVSSFGLRWELVVSVIFIALVLAVISRLLHHHFQEPTPMSKRLKEHSKKLAKTNPRPTACERGPSRALQAGQIHALYYDFESFINSRDMYYVTSNIVKPLTKEKRLSYAELAGPSQVTWFVSHYWGTSFRHFVDSICKHAQAVSWQFGISTAKLTGPWRETTYWVCSLSNNQWRVAEEVGQTWQESSFYLALRSGFCKGTAMILDNNALPLTRAWCLFELLQTASLQSEDDKFEGLKLCTANGVLERGRAGVDIAMRIGERLASLQLEEAQASVKRDKEMIDHLVSQMPGGFLAMNKFIRQSIMTALVSMRQSFEAEFLHLVQLLEGDAANGDELRQRSKPALQATATAAHFVTAETPPDAVAIDVVPPCGTEPAEEAQQGEPSGGCDDDERATEGRPSVASLPGSLVDQA